MYVLACATERPFRRLDTSCSPGTPRIYSAMETSLALWGREQTILSSFSRDWEILYWAQIPHFETGKYGSGHPISVCRQFGCNQPAACLQLQCTFSGVEGSFAVEVESSLQSKPYNWPQTAHFETGKYGISRPILVCRIWRQFRCNQPLLATALYSAETDVYNISVCTVQHWPQMQKLQTLLIIGPATLLVLSWSDS